jgi:hypothetical protein
MNYVVKDEHNRYHREVHELKGHRWHRRFEWVTSRLEATVFTSFGAAKFRKENLYTTAALYVVELR